MGNWNPLINALEDDDHKLATHPDDHLPVPHHDFPNPSVSNRVRPYRARENGVGDITNTSQSIAQANAAVNAVATPIWDNRFPINYQNLFTLTVTAGSNGTTVPSGSEDYPNGQNIAVAAAPNANYTFNEWSGTGVSRLANSGSSNTFLLMDGDASIHATFKIITRTLTLTQSGGGSATPAGSTSVDHGTVLTLTATPDTWYVFNKWAGETSSVSNIHSASTTVTMNSNWSITPNFNLMPTLDSDDNGYIESDDTTEGIIFLD